MRAEELHALGALTGGGSRGVARQARDVHRAVAARVFGALTAPVVPAAVRGPARSVALLHDVIAAGAHAGAGALAGELPRAAAALAAVAGMADGRPLGEDARGRVALGAIGGAWGDRLAADGSVLHEPLVLLRSVGPRSSVPVARPRVVVFVHGLGETELAWRRPGYAEALGGRCAVTPVHARYSSGVAVLESGAALELALRSLVADWPVPVAELTLVGHSMGGLVARVAAHAGAGQPWRAALRRIVCLGTPHEGAPLARHVGGLERGLRRLPETAPFAGPLAVRSAGIRDLADGLALPLTDDVEHLLVSATVGAHPDGLGSRLLGDLLVDRHSAWARRDRHERLRLPLDAYRHLGGATHFDLLGHPAVTELLVRTLGPPAAQLPLAGAPQRP